MCGLARGASSAPVSLWQSVTVAQRLRYKVASFSSSWMYCYTENYIFLTKKKKVKNEWVIASVVLFVVWFVRWRRSYCTSSSWHGLMDFVSLCPMHRFFLKFFLKCNQNCLKNAGNPRDMRRFQVSGFTVRANTLPTTVFQSCFAKPQTCKSILQLRTNKAFTGYCSYKRYLCCLCLVIARHRLIQTEKC